MDSRFLRVSKTKSSHLQRSNKRRNADRRRHWGFEQLEARELMAADMPNIIVINTDDQRFDTLAYMPTVQTELVPQSAVFTNSFVTTPVCSPSRANLLTGLNAYNHGVLHVTDQLGNFRNFNDTSTLATWLDGAGYNTALVGKYLNGYDQNTLENQNPNNTYVAPGWDTWRALVGASFNNPTISFNGVNQNFPQAYTTDVLSDIADDFIRSNSAGDDDPFFLYYVPHNPHEPSIVAPRHVGVYDDLEPYRPPSFNEADVSDKPQWVRNQLTLMTPAEIAEVDQFRQDQLESLLSVDEGIAQMLDALRDTGQLENTIIIFTSDNGQGWGEHRLLDKGPAWEESIRVPLLIYDGRNPTSQLIDEMALNIDLAPTIMDYAGLTIPRPVDGDSLLPLVNNETTAWRDEFLIEKYAGDGGKYYAIRTERYMYCEYTQTSGIELYDLQTDPFELTSQHNNPAYAAIKADLAARLAQLRPSDTTGPIISNASYTVAPDGIVTIQVTSSDVTTGGSEVRNAEFFIGSPGTTQNGTVLRAADGTFNSSTENLVAQLPNLAPGTYTVFVHGRDTMANWGPYVQLQVVVPQPGGGAGGLMGEYFNNTNLTGPAGTRVDATVNFPSDWGSAPAGSGVTADDNYSVRWTGFVETSTAGNWTFFTTSNDGVRLWIDDVLVIDNWTIHAVTQNSATLSLAAGWHSIRAEYFQQNGVAAMTLSFQGPGQPKVIIPSNKLRTTNPGGGTSLSIAATSANQNEGNSATTPFTFTVTRSGTTSGTTTVNYAVTGSGTNAANAADFGGTLPSGVVTFVSGQTSQVVTINVAGDTTVEPIETFTVTLSGASSGATISTATAAGTIVNDDAQTGQNGLVGEYFNSTDLTGAIATTRVDATVNFPSDWGAAPAGTSVTPDDNFSVRWTGFVETSTAGNWTFFTTSNDGVRLWIDNVQVINNWTQHAVVQNSGTLSLTAGWHAVRLEFFQQGGVAAVTFSFQGPGQAKTIIPTAKLRTTEPVASLRAQGQQSLAPPPVTPQSPKSGGTSKEVSTSKSSAAPISERPTALANLLAVVNQLKSRDANRPLDKHAVDSLFASYEEPTRSHSSAVSLAPAWPSLK